MDRKALKFAEHFYYIAAAINRSGPDGMWDEEDGFYYDLLRLPDGSATRLKVRSMVGLLPLCATTVTEVWQPERMFGGNSNWRGPIWMPVNAMIVRALLNSCTYGDGFKIECPTGSGKMMNLFEASQEIADRLTRIFTRDAHGRCPVYGGADKFQNDPHWRDHVTFYEYFHGDNGAGLGASHQTGWTGLVAKNIQLYGLLDAKRVLEVGMQAGFAKGGGR